MSKLPALTPDDPLRAEPAAPVQPPEAKPLAAVQRTAPSKPRAPRAPASSAPEPRQSRKPQPAQEWSGASDVNTFRLPSEVLQALHERSRALGIAKGMTVTAALLELFKRGDQELVELVEDAQQRYDSARRRARRAA